MIKIISIFIIATLLFIGMMIERVYRMYRSYRTNKNQTKKINDYYDTILDKIRNNTLNLKQG